MTAHPKFLLWPFALPSTVDFLGDLILSRGGNHSTRAGDSQTHSSSPPQPWASACMQGPTIYKEPLAKRLP